ncbi:MAG: flagellar protein FlgN [Gammaproteobacteria bacterium]|nr:flagellar protein FlgN [Gammaproteobacteria bacterium]MCB1862216.1 flagellar protein FlgN [Gammaproteobacteria bacterium]MCB1871033.1 flagellar protein FlgN [Gammaproteobacteria bacterium]MCB1879967.1 flagellar protein FlgN [Gammaproteobacteria bacterium]MCB1905228.1 flagellar protein FlgN [Gammaproteobacteria bacterium]
MPLPVSTSDSRQLLQMLAAERKTAGELLRLLEQEHRVLVQGEAEAIRSISLQKQAQINQLGEQLQQRDRFLAVRALPAGKAGTDLIVELLPADSEIDECWRQLQALAAQLNDRNEVNGGIVALAQRHVRQALNILTCHTEQNTTYGPAGQQTGRMPQSLAKV